jgi:hypothetical protein
MPQDPALPVRVIDLGDPAARAGKEWLVTNGLGGYAFGTVAGVPTRGYHGLLTAALPAPDGRRLVASWVGQEAVSGGERVALPTSGAALVAFRLEGGLPVWTWRVGASQLEQRLFMPHGQNATWLRTLNLGPAPVELHQVFMWPAGAPPCEVVPAPVGPRLPGERVWLAEEAARGYPADAVVEPQPLPSVVLAAGEATWLGVGFGLGGFHPSQGLADELHRRSGLLASADPALRDGMAGELVLAADAFVVRSMTRPSAERTLYAGYPWFTDWGRDTMISLEGLTLCTGRHGDARAILMAFGRSVRDGLVPNLFPEGQAEGLYHTADATLWFFHALDRYAAITGDRSVFRELFPTLVEIVWKHHQGTRFGIRVDPADGLLTQGEAGYQLTWMDAKVGDDVITPRRGKAVELNALWIRALEILADFCEGDGGTLAGRKYRAIATQARNSLQARFWCEATGCLFDVVDGESGDDASIRPNQLLALALMPRERALAALAVVERELVTPLGLRTLSPRDPAYRGKCEGDVRARDLAYHQGTAWGWLLGPYVDAVLALSPERAPALRAWLLAMEPHLSDAGLGTMSEIFDGDAPHAPRGCVAQAWTVAEWLRCFAR